MVAVIHNIDIQQLAAFRAVLVLSVFRLLHMHVLDSSPTAAAARSSCPSQ